MGLLSCDARSEAGSSIIPLSENRYPFVVLERLRKVRKVWLVEDKSASVVHSPSGPTPVSQKVLRKRASKLWERSLCLANQQDNEAAPKTVDEQAMSTFAQHQDSVPILADIPENHAELGRQLTGQATQPGKSVAAATSEETEIFKSAVCPPSHNPLTQKNTALSLASGTSASFDKEVPSASGLWAAASRMRKVNKAFSSISGHSYTVGKSITGSKMYACDICGKIVADRLDRHFTQVHKLTPAAAQARFRLIKSAESSKSMQRCTLCNKVFMKWAITCLMFMDFSTVARSPTG